jgi:hypothetical protein
MVGCPLGQSTLDRGGRGLPEQENGYKIKEVTFICRLDIKEKLGRGWGRDERGKANEYEEETGKEEQNR